MSYEIRRAMDLRAARMPSDRPGRGARAEIEEVRRARDRHSAGAASVLKRLAALDAVPGAACPNPQLLRVCAGVALYWAGFAAMMASSLGGATYLGWAYLTRSPVPGLALAVGALALMATGVSIRAVGRAVQPERYRRERWRLYLNKELRSHERARDEAQTYLEELRSAIDS